ncbi:MAG: hypothetical protein V3V11_08945 [Vicinamibacteria bacterium]
MLRNAIGLMVGSILLVSSPAFGNDAVAPHVILTWNDPYELLPQGFDRVARDIESNLGDIGIRVSWDDEHTSKRAGVRLQVLLRATDPARWELPKHTMGVVIGNKVPRSSVFIFLPNVLRTLGYGPKVKRMRPPKDVALIARGLTRVVAHEIVHAIVPEHGHDTGGLLAPKLRRDSLTSRQLDLDPPTRALLLSRLADPKSFTEVSP